MAKTHKPNEEEKIVKENVQKRFKDMFSGENEPPAILSLKEVEALQARVAELEAELVNQQATPSDDKPPEYLVKPAVQPMLATPNTKTDTSQPEPFVSGALEKRVGLWVTGISAAVGLAFFGIGLYIVFGLQGGLMELSDIVLVPFTLVMFIASSVGFNLVRRDRLVMGVWLPYLSNVIVGPILVVLVLKNFLFIMGGYLSLFTLLFVGLIFPKTSRTRALLTAVGAALVMIAIELWDPAFRLGTSHIQNFTWMVIGPAAVGILILFFVTHQLRNYGIQARLTVLMMTVMIPLLIVVSIIVTELAKTRMEAGANTELRGTSSGLASLVSTWLELNTNALEELTLMPDILSMDAEQQQPVLQAMAKAHPYMYLVSTTDILGFNVARNDDGELTDYSDREWFLGAQQGLPITYQTLIGRTTGQPALVISVPIKNASGRTVGVGMFAADLTDLAEETQVSKLGERGFTYIVDANNQAVAHPDTTVTAELRDMSAYPPVAALRQGQTGLIDFTDENGERWRAYATTLDNGWAIIAQRPESEIIAPARQFQTLVLALILAGGAVMLALVWVTIRNTLQPIATLTETISAISAGDLNRVVEVKSRDEIGKLAHTFNVMTDQIRNLIGNLEQRVADRTRELQLAAEVGRTITEKLKQQSEMLTEAVEMIRGKFDLYYTQIYLTDPSRERLILRAGTGDIGSLLLQRGHNLIVNSGSLNGRAVLEKRAQIVADTTQNPSFLPNPLLPNTRSEMSIPLIVDGNVVGVLDMQSEQPGALSESNLPAFGALAGQLAIAIRNAALFTEVQEAHSDVESRMSRFTEQGWENFLDAVHQEHKIGFAFKDSQVTRLQPEVLSTTTSAQSLNLPITVTGAKVGEIQLPGNLKASELELVRAISEQLAQHVENLRLLAQAETFRKEAEIAVRRLTHEGWESYSNNNQIDTGYVYDLNQVHPISGNDNSGTDQAIKRPLVVRDEPIGELKLDLLELSEEANEILSAVAEQLSGHLENLRLSELNERHAQREQTLRQITSALRSSTNPTTIMRTAVRELGSILGRRAVIQMAAPEKVGQVTKNETDSPANPDGAVGGNV
ncbi:MAG TPA: cache domain-containing protein [Anaerolineales bacterium]|nr:cache domain-containing protein [Anaerolineales bacterium]